MTNISDEEFDDVLEGAKEIGKFLHMKPRSVYYHVERGRLPIYRYKTRIRARKRTLLKWVEDQERRNSKGGRRDHPEISIATNRG